MLQLSPEDSLLLLTCRPYLRIEEDLSVRRLAKASLNWPYLLWRSENNRALPLLEYHLRRLEVLAYIPKEAATFLRRWTTLSKLRSLLQYQQLGIILDSFEDNGLPYFLLKGSALAALYYPERLMRPMQDIDLMIRPRDALLAQRVMSELGYDNGIFDPSTGAWHHIRKEITPESLQDHHGLPAFVKVLALKTPISKNILPRSVLHKHVKCFIDDTNIMQLPMFVDLHITLSVGIDTSDVWTDLHLEKVLGRIARVQSITGMLWFIAARLYHEAFEFNTFKLVMFGDVHTLIHRCPEQINWPQLVAIAYKYEMRPALYYVLSQARSLTGVVVPDGVLDLLRPDPMEIPLEHDWGDVMPKLLSIPYLAEFKLA